MSAAPQPALLFDCDGVILDSNALKTQAFRAVGEQFGPDAARALVDYHLAHGGVSRYRKFEYLLSEILGEAPDADRVASLAADYGAAVRRGLLECAVAPGLEQLRVRTREYRWCIVSGGDQAELRDVFAVRGLDYMFDGGIHGSPTPKADLLEALSASIDVERSVFLGDSEYDHACARQQRIRFVFVHGWTEMRDWVGFCRRNGVPAVRGVADALPLIMEIGDV